MKTTEVIKAMNKNGLRFVTVDTLTELTGQSRAAAKMVLSRLNGEEVVTRIKRGLYVNNLAADVHEYEALPYLTAPHPSYVSLFSILSERGLIDDMVPAVYGVTTGTSTDYRASSGIYRIYHIKEELMWGYEEKRYKHGVRIVAEPEKAFLDLVYLSKTPSRDISLPGNWPEIYRKLDRKKFKDYIQKADSKRLDNFLKKAEQKLQDGEKQLPSGEGDTVKLS